MKTTDSEIEMPKMAEVDAQAIESLLSTLGPMKTAAFIREHMSSKTDSIVLKEQLFNGLSIDAMVGEIREAHDGQEKKNADKPKN